MENTLAQREDVVILNEIKVVWDKIDSFDYYLKSCSDYERLVNHLVQLVRELTGSTNEKLNKQARRIFGEVSHTVDKEVGYVRYHYDKKQKRNAAKVRTQEYYDSIEVATRQLNMEIIGLLEM